MNVVQDVGALLGSRGRFAAGRADAPWLVILAFVAAGGLIYGAAMGSFAGRPLQSLYSAIKVPVLVFGSALVCLPNFLVVNTVLALRDDFSAALRAVLQAQATVSLALVSLAPITLFQYSCVEQYESAMLANGIAFAVSTYAGQVTLTRHYRVLIARNPKHRKARAAWVWLYVFVAIQLAWTLRPFVGDPRMEVALFREKMWGNAYVAIWNMFTGLQAGG